jgi:SAM-dependent methyltransferase
MEQHKFTPSQAREFFNRQADTYIINYQHHPRNYSHIFGIANIQPYETVLELGCGIGLISLQAARTAHCAVGIDIAEQLIKRARDTIGDLGLQLSNIGFGVGDITNRLSVAQALANLSPPVSDMPASKRFDVVVLSEVTQYIPENLMGALFEVVKNYLQPGGRIIMTWESEVKVHHTVDLAIYRVELATGRWIPQGTSHVGGFIGGFIGGLHGCERARGEADRVASDHGLQVMEDCIVDWPSNGYRDNTVNIHLRAQARAGERALTQDDLEEARCAWMAEVEGKLRGGWEW